MFGPRKASIEIACEPRLIYEILTDYDSYFEWMPLVSKSTLLAQEGDLAIAELVVDAGGPQKLAIECIHDRNRMVLSRDIGGALLVSKVQWDISEAGPGRSKVEITMSAKSWRDSLNPTRARFLNPGACLEALRRQTALFEGAGASQPGAERVLQILESPDGLVAWYLGKQYKMVPVEDKQ